MCKNNRTVVRERERESSVLDLDMAVISVYQISPPVWFSFMPSSLLRCSSSETHTHICTHVCVFQSEAQGRTVYFCLASRCPLLQSHSCSFRSAAAIIKRYKKKERSRADRYLSCWVIIFFHIQRRKICRRWQRYNVHALVNRQRMCSTSCVVHV